MPRILITPGEPAGIGPDITIQIAQAPWLAELVIVADPALLAARALQLQLPLFLTPYEQGKKVATHQPGHLKFIPVELKSPARAGELNPANAAYVLRCLEIAADHCLQGKAQALVTGPVHKGVINDAHIPFMGHTEFLAAYCQVPQAIMLFAVDELKVALMTTHIPLAAVPKAITANLIKNTVRLLASELQKKFKISKPTILMCGLNPHAGENGHLGSEEIDIIIPALEELKAENIKIIGPLPADTVFTKKYLAMADVVLAMYHDQGLPVVKQLSFGHAVNVTLGLPIIRTSVDHGTALDIAGTKKADAGSLEAAIRLAMLLTP